MFSGAYQRTVWGVLVAKIRPALATGAVLWNGEGHLINAIRQGSQQAGFLLEVVSV